MPTPFSPDFPSDPTPVPHSEVVSSSNVMAALLGGLDQLAEGAFLLEGGAAEHRVVYVNRAFVDALERQDSDVLGQPLAALFPTAVPALSAALRAGSHAPTRVTVERASPGTKPERLELSFHPVRDTRDQIRHWLGFVRDASHARESLERERLAAVELLAAGMAHEVNNPLASITTNLEWLVMQLPGLVKQAGGSASANEFAGAISAALVDALVGAERIEATIRYLSMLSGMEDERRDLLDVRTLLDAAVTELEGQIASDIRVQRDYADVPPVMASEQRLKQAFVNLILNAAQAIGHQASERVITLRVLDGARVRVQVEDTGSGVAPEVEARLFSPFVTTKPPGMGKGLGLFLCRRILEAAGGGVGFSSQAGRGATFWVELPVRG